MPDAMTHLILGLILAELFGIRKKSLVLIGTLLPDLSKIFLIFFYLGMPLPIFFGSFETPLMSFLVSILISPLFIYDKLKTIVSINIGVISHYLADLTLKHFGDIGIMLFFPFTMKNYHLNWVWPEQSIYVLIASLIVYLIIKFVKKTQAGKVYV